MRRIQFSLAALLMVLSGIAVLCGEIQWLGEPKDAAIALASLVYFVAVTAAICAIGWLLLFALRAWATWVAGLLAGQNDRDGTNRPRAFGVSALSASIIALAMLIAYSMFPDERYSAFARWFLFPLSLSLPIVLLLIPACWFANKLAQSFCGRLPPDELADAEPIRLDRPRDDNTDGDEG